MDYHSLKRRELQALCKKHNIPANSANSVLADKLSALFNEKQKPKTQQRTCVKSSVETIDEGEPAASKRQAKKVRFSPNTYFVEYELRSSEKQKDMVTQTKARRKSVAKKVDKPVVDDNTTVEFVDDSAQVPVNITRSNVRLLGKDVVNPNNVKKQTRRGAKYVEKGTDVDKEIEGGAGRVTRSKAHTLQKDGGVQLEESKQSKRLVKNVEEANEIVEEIEVGRVRVTRSKASTLMEGGAGRDAEPRVNKKTAKQVKTDEQSVEPDIPVRATRSTRQTRKEDIGNTITNSQADKKRTRREMKATDLSSNSSDVAPVDKQTPPKRKSMRTRGVETVDENKGNKMEVVNASRVARPKAPFSEKNCKNRANKVETQQLEEPLKPAGKKNVNRRKSVFPSEKTEVDLHGEEPVNHPARKNTRRKSVIQKATKTAESPTRTPKSRKRRGSPILEDQIIEPEYGFLVDKSPKSSTRSASKREGKSVARKQVESSLKKPMTRMNNKSSVENASPERKSLANRGGSLIRDGWSNKRAKLSEMKQSDSEDHAVNFCKKETPVAKMSTFKLDEEVSKPPAVDESDRLFARSTIRGERKEPSPSAINEQPITKSQLSSPKVAKFIPNPAVNTAPGRITRSGIEHSGISVKVSKIKGKLVERKQVESSLKKAMSRMNNKSSVENPSPQGKSSANRGDSLVRDSRSKKRPKLSGINQSDLEGHAVNSGKKETPVAKMSNLELDEEVTEPDVTPAVDKSDRLFTRSTIRAQRKEPSSSAIKEQPIAESQLFSPKVAKFIPDPVVGTTPGRITRSGIKHSVNVAGSFSEKVSKKKQVSQSTHKTQPLDDAQIAPSKAAKAESEFSKEAPSQILGTLSASESVRLPAKIVENRGSMSGTAIDMEKESVVSGDNVYGEVMEDAGACIGNSTHEASATPCSAENLASGKQQNLSELLLSDNESPLEKDLSHIKIASVSMADVAEIVPDAVSDVSNVQNQNEEAYAESEIFSEVLKSGRPDAREQEMELTESGSPTNGMQNDVLIDEPPVSSRKEVVVEEQSDVMIEEPLAFIGKEAVVEEQTDMMIEEPLVSIGKAVVVEEQSDVMIEEPPVSIGKEVVVEEQIDVMIEEPLVSIGKAVVVEEQTDVMIEEPLVSIGEAVVVEGVNISSRGVVTMENIGDTDKNSAHVSYDVGSYAVSHSPIEQSGSGYMMSASGGKMGWLGSLQISSVDEHDVGDDGEHYDEDESASAQKSLTSEPDSEDRSVAHGVDVQENSFSGKDIYGKCYKTISDRKSCLDMFATPLIGKGDVRDDGINVSEELETGSELSNANKTLEAPVSGTDIDTERVFEDTGDVQDGECKHDQLASNDNHATDGEDVGGDDLEPAQNKNAPMADEVLVRSCHQELEQVLNVVVDDVSCDTVGLSDSVMSKDEHKTIAICGIDDMVVKIDDQEEFAVDINKDVVSRVLGDIYDMDAEYDSGNEQTLTEFDEGFQPNECGGVFSDMRNEQTKEEADTSRGNAHILDDEEQAAATDDGLDGGKFMEEDGSHIGVNDAGTSMDWGGYDIETDGFENSVSPNRSDDMKATGEKDDEDLDLQTSARTSCPMEEIFGLAAGQEDAVDFANQDHYASLKLSYASPAATHISHVKDTQEDATNFANKDMDSSLKSVSTAPATSSTSHINDWRTDAVNFTFSYGRCNEDTGLSGTATHEFSHQREDNQMNVFDGETQGDAKQGPENRIQGVPRFEDYSYKLFEDEEVGGSIARSGSKTHFEFKPSEFLNDASGPGHYEPSEDISTRSDEFEKKEDALMKGSEVDNDLVFDLGHAPH